MGIEHSTPLDRTASKRSMRLASSLPAGSTYPNNHNGGPPLEDECEHVPEWSKFGIRTYFSWKRAYNQVWKSVPHAIMLRRLQKARACGLTYEEYTLFLLDTGRYLQPEDQEIIAHIIGQRSTNQ